MRAKVEEVPELTFNDKATRNFLNIHGNYDDEVSGELVELLHYLENTTDEFAEKAKSPRIKRIHDCVKKESKRNLRKGKLLSVLRMN